MKNVKSAEKNEFRGQFRGKETQIPRYSADRGKLWALHISNCLTGWKKGFRLLITLQRTLSLFIWLLLSSASDSDLTSVILSSNYSISDDLIFIFLIIFLISLFHLANYNSAIMGILTLSGPYVVGGKM